MQKPINLYALSLLLLGASSQVTAANAPDSVFIYPGQRGASVSPTMYGVFFEEINHAGDGGLYAELVQNRSFEELEMPEGYHAEGCHLYPRPVKNHIDGKIKPEKYRWTTEPVPGWELAPGDSLHGSIRLTKENPKFAAAPNNLEISVNGNKAPVTLINDGYWGMGLHKGENYKLRIIGRTERGYKGDITALLLAENGDTLASQPIKLKNDGKWNDITLTMTPDAATKKGKLALVFNRKGKVWLDYVSLFPESTFNNRDNGLRKDVATMLADLNPAFVRWPGGCVVEGISLDNRFEWKKTLGDPAARPGEYSTWGYRCSYGFGYHEMLQFCEDINAGAMFVCNVGLGCQFRMGDASPEEKIDYYLQDCLDAIEYALGDTTTTWGSRRAAAGHPTPFPLKYVEIGNENWGDEYDRRFDIFYKAIKEKYPELVLISNHGLQGTGKITVTDMIDPHFYVEPEFFYTNTRLFDNHPRGNYKVYVGEYACNREVGGGNMNAALSEAAFIGGMERNSDLVTMASYAPLFENRHDRTWSTNLIWIDSDDVMGRASYYVQKMAAENRPTCNVALDVKKSRADTTDVSPRQFIFSGYDDNTGEIIIKAVNATGDGYNVNFSLGDDYTIAKSGKVITLAAASLEDENSWDEPEKIIPVESRFDGFGSQFSYEFKPFSYTILRVKALPKYFTNPVVFADIPDPDVIRVGDNFYMVSTTMHFSPGCQIMKSRDLVNWQVIGSAYDRLEDTDAFSLKNGQNDYAKGSWAANLRYDPYEKLFYLIVSCNTTRKSYIFTTPDIEHGPWHRNEVEMCYDPGLLFDDTGKECKKYIVYPDFDLNVHTAYYRPIISDGKGNVTLGKRETLIDYTQIEKPSEGLRAEGYHGYRIGDYYYIFMIQGQGWQRQETVWRAKELAPGAFESRKIFTGNIENPDGTAHLGSTGVAQGGIVDTPDGKWYAMLFQDYGAVGRIPVLVPVTWNDGWPVLGNDGKSVDHTLPMPVATAERHFPVVSDEFDNRTPTYRYSDMPATSPEHAANGSWLKPEWQWNHNPDNRFWSLTERLGYLRLKSGHIATSIRDARNTLTQRTFGPVSTAETAIETSNMRDGDRAGISAFQNQYGYVGVKRENGKNHVIMHRASCKDDSKGIEIESIPIDCDRIYLRTVCDFRDKTDKASFYYSLDGKEWKRIGDTLQMNFDWPDFVGQRFALFYFSTANTGGSVDFDYFHVKEG